MEITNTITRQSFIQNMVSLKDQAIQSAVILLCNHPDFLVFSTCGGLLGGLPGMAVGAAFCLFVRTQTSQDSADEDRLAISGREVRCNLPNCQLCDE